MNTNEELFKDILDTKLDEVAKARYPKTYKTRLNIPATRLSLDVWRKASLLAMQELSAFYEWVSLHGYLRVYKEENVWSVSLSKKRVTTTELYKLWKEGKG